MKRLMPCLLAASNSTWVPITLFSVNANELPNELSTCVCGHAATRTCRSPPARRARDQRDIRQGRESSSEPTFRVEGMQGHQCGGACLGCGVDDGVDLLLLEDVRDEIRRQEVPLDEFVV